MVKNKNQYIKYKFIEKNFSNLRNQICSEFESIENNLNLKNNISLKPGKFSQKKWKRKPDEGFLSGGGGVMSIMHGRVFEKVGVNISTVMGSFTEEMKNKIPGAKKNPNFYATGISLVAHMHSPLIPAAHFNTRFIRTTKNWFGGGADLTPTYLNKSKLISNLFHSDLKKTCDNYDPLYYPKYKKWCDEYFYLPHRKEKRGLGGIFFDYLDNDFDNNYKFIKDIGQTFLKSYSKIITSKINKVWNNKQKNDQLLKRGRYVEFNLLYDRGTAFGLKTEGNIDAIFMSLPPSVSWK
jgi:coproporphyrinogen III oxidase